MMRSVLKKKSRSRKIRRRSGNRAHTTVELNCVFGLELHFYYLRTRQTIRYELKTENKKKERREILIRKEKKYRK